MSANGKNCPSNVYFWHTYIYISIYIKNACNCERIQQSKETIALNCIVPFCSSRVVWSQALKASASTRLWGCALLLQVYSTHTEKRAQPLSSRWLSAASPPTPALHWLFHMSSWTSGPVGRVSYRPVISFPRLANKIDTQQGRTGVTPTGRRKKSAPYCTDR